MYLIGTGSQLKYVFDICTFYAASNVQKVIDIGGFDQAFFNQIRKRYGVMDIRAFEKYIEGSESIEAFVATSNLKAKGVLVRRLSCRVTFTNVIHPHSTISESATVHRMNVMIGARAVLQPYCTIKTGSFINTGAIIEHDVQVGPFSTVAPGAVLCGWVNIGEGAFVGAGACIKPGVHVGDGAMVGMGAVVTKDVPEFTVVCGNPARRYDGKRIYNPNKVHEVAERAENNEVSDTVPTGGDAGSNGFCSLEQGKAGCCGVQASGWATGQTPDKDTPEV